MNNAPILYTAKHEEEIQAFITLHFGENAYISHELDSEYVHTDTAVVAPDGQSRTFVTFGMGAREMNSPTDVRRIELAISASEAVDVCSKESFWLAGEITHISKYPFREDTWLEAGHTINTSEDFKKHFGYDYFALWDLELSFQPTGMDDEVHFCALVPLYDEEREWIVHNDTFAFMYHLYDVYGDRMFCADLPRDICIPDWDDRKQYEQVLMRGLDLTRDQLHELFDRLEENEENGEQLTSDLLASLLEELR